jgi:hypothetical protein
MAMQPRDRVTQPVIRRPRGPKRRAVAQGLHTGAVALSARQRLRPCGRRALSRRRMGVVAHDGTTLTGALLHLSGEAFGWPE